MECNLHSYDKYIVSFSGGKDSTACFLYLLDNGIPLDKIELWHQDIDGREDTFFDWEVTPDYCRSLRGSNLLPVERRRLPQGTDAGKQPYRPQLF